MGRRTVLLIVAALIAALGTGMVFLYVRSADSRAEANQQPLQVLKAVAKIKPGETLADAQAAGKIQLGSVPKSQVLPGAVNSTTGLDKAGGARRPIYPGADHQRQVRRRPATSRPSTIPDGEIAISVNLSDTGRVAGFVSPGAKVAIFLTTTRTTQSLPRRHADSLLLQGRGDRASATPRSSRPPRPTPAARQTTEQLPKTLFTLARDPARRPEGHLRRQPRRPRFALLTDKSNGQARTRASLPRTCSGELTMPIIVESSRSNSDLFTVGHRRRLPRRRQPRGAQAAADRLPGRVRHRARPGRRPRGRGRARRHPAGHPAVDQRHPDPPPRRHQRARRGAALRHARGGRRARPDRARRRR